MSSALIVQSDHTVLLDVHDPEVEEARNDIAAFTELEKSPEHFHTYRITPLSLWNAASAGFDAAAVVDALERHSRYPVPPHIAQSIRESIARYGALVLEATDDDYTLRLIVRDEDIAIELSSRAETARYLRPDGSDNSFLVDLTDRGTLKQVLIGIGYPVDDRAPLTKGEPIEFSLRDKTTTGHEFVLRGYQREAAAVFHGDNRPGAGYGAVVLPCGAGKTIVGMAVMDLLKTSTLILTTNVAAVHQWIDELIDKTEIDPETIGEYTGTQKEIKPITVATYQILVWRPDRDAAFPHFDLFRRRNWGLIIYDEVHLLPAPVFRVTAEIQAIRRLGLTATLVREDGRERDVFSLVGPKRYDVPWKELEQKGWIAEAVCYEIRLDLSRGERRRYAIAEKRNKFRIASENPRKVEACVQIVANHREDAILVIGQYLDQLAELAKALNAPIITGKTPNAKREEIYAAFRNGELRVIVVSKVANFAIDLPDASVAIQVSGAFGSRQEEAQRLGRILRPKSGRRRNASFYSLVSNETVEEEFAANRQRFLTEQGYSYHIEHWAEPDA